MRKTIACLLLGILWAANDAQARTFYVAKSGDGGNNSNSCTAAQNIATPKLTLANFFANCGMAAGDTLYIRRGTYNDVINTQVTPILGGTSFSNGPVIAGWPSDGNRQVIINGDGVTEAVAQLGSYLSSDSAYLTIRNLILDGGNSAGGLVGIHADFQRFDNVEIRNTWPLPNRTLGVFLSDSADGAEFLNCEVHHTQGVPGVNSGYGWYHTGTNMLIDNCDVHDNFGYAVHIFNSGSNSVSGNTIRNSRFWNNNTGGVVPYQIIMGSGSNNRSYNNVIYSGAAGAGGIHADFRCLNCLIANNVIRNHTGAAIEVSAASGAVSVTVRNNILVSNATSISLVSSPNITANNNMCAASGTCTDMVAGGVVGTGTSLNSALASFPRFADAANNDYRLCTEVGVPHVSCVGASPAIGVGANLSTIFVTDAVGTVRTVPWDLGPYAASGAAPTGPVVTITSPTNMASYSVVSANLVLGGMASSGVAIAKVTWACPTCTPTSGTASGTSSWSAAVTLASGNNVITVTATDNNAATATDQITVNLAAQSLVYAAGFDEVGSSVLDSSGNSNTGTLGSGATRVAGVSGGAIFFDGTADGVITVPDSDSLDLAGGYTVSMYVSPTELVNNSWRALLTKYADYWFYATSGDGTCPAGNKAYGGYDSGASYEALCSGSALSTNIWTYLTFKWDGKTQEIYFNTTLVASRTATAFIASNANDLLIGNSPYSEGFKGFIDRVRIYNYAIPLTAGNNTCSAAPSITRDMNCRIGTTTITIKLNVTTRKTGPTITRKYGPPS